jgi:hypothetical protein
VFAEYSEMKKQSAYEKFLNLSPAERAAETARFDHEFDESEFRELDEQSKQIWERAKRKRGRPPVGQGAKTISVSVEKGLLDRADALANQLGVTRAKLIAGGLTYLLQTIEQERVSPSEKLAATGRGVPGREEVMAIMGLNDPSRGATCTTSNKRQKANSKTKR